MPDLGWSTYISGIEDSAFYEAVMESQWFVDEGGSFLIPDPFGDDYFVDTGIAPQAVKTLNKWYQENSDLSQEVLPIVPAEIYEPLGLSIIPDNLKRYDSVAGFYHA